MSLIPRDVNYPQTSFPMMQSPNPGLPNLSGAINAFRQQQAMQKRQGLQMFFNSAKLKEYMQNQQLMRSIRSAVEARNAEMQKLEAEQAESTRRLTDARTDLIDTQRFGESLNMAGKLDPTLPLPEVLANQGAGASAQLNAETDQQHEAELQRRAQDEAQAGAQLALTQANTTNARLRSGLIRAQTEGEEQLVGIRTSQEARAQGVYERTGYNLTGKINAQAYKELMLEKRKAQADWVSWAIENGEISGKKGEFEHHLNVSEPTPDELATRVVEVQRRLGMPEEQEPGVLPEPASSAAAGAAVGSGVPQAARGVQPLSMEEDPLNADPGFDFSDVGADASVGPLASAPPIPYDNAGGQPDIGLGPTSDFAVDPDLEALKNALEGGEGAAPTQMAMGGGVPAMGAAGAMDMVDPQHQLSTILQQVLQQAQSYRG